MPDWLRAFGLIATLAATACPGGGVSPPADAHTSAEAVLELARAYVSSGPATVAIEARASQYSDQGGLKGKVEILAERPGRLRMTGLSPTDDMVSVLATDGTRFTAFERGAKVCFVGRACPSNVGRFVSIPLEADELVGVLTGRPPIIPHGERRLTWDRDVGGYRLELFGAGADLAMSRGRVQRLWVGHDDGRILRTALIEGGKTIVDVRYSAMVKRDGHLMPTRLDAKLARDSTDLRLDYRDIDLSPELGDGAFAFVCPGGTTLEELPCLESP
jgi:outer membrane lipoprotein-sorting protein